MTALRFKTAARSAEALLKEKGSRFIAHIDPIASEDDAKARVKALWEAHPSATHVCYAYRLGPEPEVYRQNDDGEPSGTAGKPIYNQIRSFELWNVCIAVVRYFGGTQLGVPGLIQAYKESARLAIQACEIIEVEPRAYRRITLAYDQLAPVMTWIKRQHWAYRWEGDSEGKVLRIEYPKHLEKDVNEGLKNLGIET